MFASLPPQYNRFKWRKSNSVAVGEHPRISLGIVRLCGSTVDLRSALEYASCRICMIELKSYGTPWEADLLCVSNFSSKPSFATRVKSVNACQILMCIKEHVHVRKYATVLHSKSPSSYTLPQLGIRFLVNFISSRDELKVRTKTRHERNKASRLPYSSVKNMQQM